MTMHKVASRPETKLSKNVASFIYFSVQHGNA